MENAENSEDVNWKIMFGKNETKKKENNYTARPEIQRRTTRVKRQRKRVHGQEMFTEVNRNQHKFREVFKQTSNLKTSFRPRSGQLFKKECDFLLETVFQQYSSDN